MAALWYRRAVFAALAALVFGMSAAGVRAQTAGDPGTVFRQFADAINRGDVDGALAVFDQNIEWQRGNQCPAGACVEKTAVRRELERDVANHHSLKVTDVQGSTIRVELQTDGTRRAGVDRIIQLFTIALRGDKINRVQVAVDPSDAQTASFRDQGGAVDVVAPSSSSGSGGGFPWIIVIIVAVVAVGALGFLGRKRIFGRRSEW